MIDGTEIRIYFARGRNALVARADFAELYASLILHEVDHGIRLQPELEAMLRDALAAVTLHGACRPYAETFAWTIHCAEPLVNLFATCANPLGTVTGTLHTEEVKPLAKGLFYVQTTADAREPRLSVVEFEGADVFAATEEFYAQSEQRVSRLFRYAEEDVVLVSAQPDCDVDWLNGLDREQILRLDQDVELSLLETRIYRFECGCSLERMESLLAPAMRADPEALFAGEPSFRMRCPRCGARYEILRKG